MLSDDESAGIAHEVMHRTGLSPYGQEDEAVRWVAVRHGNDHIHLVAMLARQDGGKPSLSWERYKVRAACLAAEQRYGLRSTAPADCTAARLPTRAENDKAARCGLDEAPRVILRRQVTTAAASASSEDEFFARLDQARVQVRKRFSVSNPGQVTGYSVTLPGDTTKDGGPVWYGGGKLAADLSWPKLRQRWTPDRVTPGRPDLNLTAAERNAIWEHATRIAADATAQIRTLAWTDPAAATDAAWATSDTVHVAAAMLGSRILRQAADAYDRAARAPYAHIPPPSQAGNQLRQAARLLSAFAYLTGDRSMTRSCSSPGWPHSPKPSPNSANPSSTQPRPPQPAPPPNSCTLLPARHHPHSRTRPSAPPPPPSSPGCPSPSQPGQPRDQRHQDSPARLQADRHQCHGRHHQGRAAPPADDASTHSSAPQIYGSSARVLRDTRRTSVVASPPCSRCRRRARLGANRRMATSGSCHG